MTHHIDKANYEGYIWWSDQERPKVYDGTKEVTLELNDGKNPFVIEGNLWDEASRKSISIRYVDDRYFVKTMEVAPEDLKGNGEKCTRKQYIAHRIDGVRRLNFLQYWETFGDDLCEKMETLRPEKLVFVGFDKKDKED